MVSVEIFDPINSSWYFWIAAGELGSLDNVLLAAIARAGSIKSISRPWNTGSRGVVGNAKRERRVLMVSEGGEDTWLKIRIAFGFLVNNGVWKSVDNGVVKGLHTTMAISACRRARATVSSIGRVGELSRGVMWLVDGTSVISMGTGN